MTIVAPVMVDAQRDAWLGLLEVAAKLSAGWCLVGGQMVHLHCWERGFGPNRPTNDGDAVLDVRGHPSILHDFTRTLTAIGFTSAGPNMSGHEHRWMRGEASIDVLIPDGLGDKASSRRGITGSTTLSTPGAQQAIQRSELIDVNVAGTRGQVPRPNLLGALVVKAAAYGVPADPLRDRHLTDLAVLAAMIRRNDNIAIQLTERDRDHLAVGIRGLAEHRSLWAGIDGAERGVDLLSAFIKRT